MAFSKDAVNGTENSENRYSSFAGVSQGNHGKFHVAGCAYFWAVSEALLKAKRSIWIMGCTY